MGLYFSISSSGEEAIQQDPILVIEDYIHDAIFLGPLELDFIETWSDGSTTENYYYPEESERDWLKQYPLFWRMRDQYCDCIIYDQIKIVGLIKELEAIKKTSKEPNLSKFIEQLMGLCEQALNSKKKIFCYGD